MRFSGGPEEGFVPNLHGPSPPGLSMHLPPPGPFYAVARPRPRPQIPHPPLQSAMNTSHNAARRAAVLLAAFGFTAIPAFAQGNGNGNKNRIPTIPSGWLTAFPTVVQTGTKPTLTWSISYPSVVKHFVEIIEPGTIKVKEKLDVEIRVLGNGVTAHNSNGQFVSWVDAEASVSHNGGSYTPVFNGSNLDVDPNLEVLEIKDVTKGDTLNFGGQYFYGSSEGPFQHSTGGTQNVRTLVAGGTPPTTEPMHLAPTLEDFIRPYLDGNGHVDIGPMDVIVFMELTHDDSQQSHQGYDLQDLVLLVTFKSDKPKNNNGHGNNVDGVDMSNPGSAPFMQYDSDPTVDDEGTGGGAEPSQ